MSSTKDDAKVDQEALAAAWGASLDGTAPDESDDEVAAQWAAMIGDNTQETDANATRVLDQKEIDSVLGFSFDEAEFTSGRGLDAIVNSAAISYERLPLLEVVFDRLVRLMTASLRVFTSDVVEVSLEKISSVRLGDYLDSIPLPAIIGVFRVEEWGNHGIVTVESSLIYSIIDVLLGGGRSGPVRVEGRPYTTIETSLMRRMIDVVLRDTEQAFLPVATIRINTERLETNPRFATITQPANAAILVELRIDFDDRGGKLQMLLPNATIEPIRDLLMQMFMGEKFGRDAAWEGHLASEIWESGVDVDAVLFEKIMPLRNLAQLKVGDVLDLGLKPDAPVAIRCGDTELTIGRMGRVGKNVAVRVCKPLRKSRVSMDLFEQVDRQLAT